MAENLPDEYLLINYLDNEMEPGERDAFENLVNTDAGLRERLEKLRIAKDAVTYYGIRQQVTEVRKLWEQSNAGSEEVKRAKVIPMKRTMRYALVAASIIIVIIGIKSFFLTSVSPETIYQETYIGYNLGDTRSQATDRSPVEKAYQQKNYPEVVALGQQTSLNAKEQLLLGIAYLQVNDPASAITRLEGLQQSGDPTYHQDAEFYLGLAYLKNKEYSKALSVLRKIQSDPRHLYHNQVSEKTIKEIERLRL